MKIRLNVVTALLTFGGLFLRLVLGALGFEKASQKLENLCDVIEDDYQENGDRHSELGRFGESFFSAGMAILIVAMGLFGELFYVFSKK